MLREALQADRCYVLDRWYAEFRLFNDIRAIGSSYVCRLRDNSDLRWVQEERPIAEEAQNAGVLRDLVVKMGTTSKPEAQPDHLIRVVLIKTTNHTRGGLNKAPSSDGILRIATNLMDVPAEIIGDIFRHRWLVETFFFFFKHILGCRHLLSQDPVGIEIQTYCAIIACLLISLYTGRKPTLRTYEMVCHYFTGLADEEELLAHIQKLKPPRRVARCNECELRPFTLRGSLRYRPMKQQSCATGLLLPLVFSSAHPNRRTGSVRGRVGTAE